jgi:hypothetical protein
MIKPDHHRYSRSNDHLRRGVMALVVGAGIIALGSGAAGAASTEQLRNWGPECRTELNRILPPNYDSTGIDRSREEIFNACMANGGYLPGNQPPR